jgi:hypothetical protein
MKTKEMREMKKKRYVWKEKTSKNDHEKKIIIGK